MTASGNLRSYPQSWDGPRPIPTALLPGVTRWIDRAEPFSLLLLLAFVAPLVSYSASFQVTVTATRAFLPFTLFLLILMAAGIASLAQSFAAIAGSLVALVALLASSSIYFHDRALSPRDYKAVGNIIAREERAGDIVLVRRSSWSDSPIFYHFPDARYVTDEELSLIAAQRRPRIWLPQWLDRREDRDDPCPALLALVNYVEAEP